MNEEQWYADPGYPPTENSIIELRSLGREYPDDGWQGFLIPKKSLGGATWLVVTNNGMGGPIIRGSYHHIKTDLFFNPMDAFSYAERARYYRGVKGITLYRKVRCRGNQCGWLPFCSLLLH